MAISFDTLPSAKPLNEITKGSYYATIEIAEMRNPKDSSKAPYLNMMFALKTAEGASAGKIYDILTDSDKDLLKYKLARFIKALKLDTTLTTFELADLCKIIKNKTLIVDVVPEIKDGVKTGRTVVDLFTNEIYYPVSDAKLIFKDAPATLQVIDEDDAEDAAPVHNDTISDEIF